MTAVLERTAVVTETRKRRTRSFSRALLVATNVAGAATLVAPMLSRHGVGPETVAHSSDAPVLVALAVPALLAIAVGEIAGGRLDSKGVALLGVLCGLNAVLRLPGAFAGASLVFFLPIVCGYVFGSRQTT